MLRQRGRWAVMPRRRGGVADSGAGGHYPTCRPRYRDEYHVGGRIPGIPPAPGIRGRSTWQGRLSRLFRGRKYRDRFGHTARIHANAAMPNPLYRNRGRDIEHGVLGVLRRQSAVPRDAQAGINPPHMSSSNQGVFINYKRVIPQKSSESGILPTRTFVRVRRVAASGRALCRLGDLLTITAGVTGPAGGARPANRQK